MNKSRFLVIATCIFFTLLQGCKKDEQEDPEPTDTVPCLPTGLTANLVAFYPFSNGSLNDFSGNGIHLTNNTTAKSAPDRNGNPNCAFEFDNYPVQADSLVATNTQMLNGMAAFSISLWYQPLDTMVQMGFAKREYMAMHGTWQVELYDCRKATFSVRQASSAGYSVWDTQMVAYTTPNACHEEQKLRTGGWHHLVVTFDNASSMAKIYRDNVLQEAGGYYTTTTPYPVPNVAHLLIGSGLTGRLDDIAIFNKALTDAEIGSLFNMGTCCSE